MKNILANAGSILIFALYGSMMSSTVLASETYRAEASLSWFGAESDNFDSDGYFISGHYYFSPVDTRDHPLAEAVFLERKSHISFLANKYDFDNILGDSKGAGGLVQAVYMNANGPLMVVAGYQSDNIEYDYTSKYEVDIKGYNIGLGYFLAKPFLVEVSYEKLDTEYTTILPIEDDETITRELSVKYVNKLESGKAYNMEAGVQYNKYIDSLIEDKDKIISLEGDYYFTNAFSTGLDFERQTGDVASFEGDTIGLRSRFFFTPQYAINVQYNKFKADDSLVDDSKSYLVGFSGRF